MLVDYSVYRVVVGVHIFSVFVFLLAHGASAMSAFQLKTERRRERVAALRELSAFASFGMSIALMAVLITAIILAWLGEWFGAAWFWTALVVFFALTFVMTPFATGPYSTARRSMALKGPRMVSAKGRAPTEPLSDEELDKVLARVNPWALTGVGLGGIGLLQWLMMFKPF